MLSYVKTIFKSNAIMCLNLITKPNVQYLYDVVIILCYICYYYQMWF